VTAINDIIQLVTTAELFGQVINNVYHYKITTLGTGNVAAEETVASWLDMVLPDLRNVMTASMQFRELFAVNLGFPSDFYATTLAIDGNIPVGTSPGQPSWMTLVFRYNRVSAADRNGYKKIAGVTENNTAGNAWSGAAGLITDIENALGGIIGGSISSGYIMTPFVAHRPISYGTNPTGYIPSSVKYSMLSTQRSRL